MDRIIEPPSPEKLAELGTFTSALVHELRNPLNSIKANLQLMEEDFEREEAGDGPHLRRTRRLLKEVERLEKTLNNFFLYMKSRGFEFRTHDLSRIVDDVAALISPQADHNGITILVDTPERLEADVDPEAIKQTVLNLAINAMHALETMKSDSGEILWEPKDPILILKLSRTEKDSREYAHIEVTDTGRGISEADQKRIFDLFFTTREGGTGIGLAVVQKIIEGHHGSISTNSLPERGTSFVIEIPVKQNG